MKSAGNGIKENVELLNSLLKGVNKQKTSGKLNMDKMNRVETNSDERATDARKQGNARKRRVMSL